MADYVSKLRDTLSTVIEAVKGHQARASERQKTSYDFRANFQDYSEGELVWVQNKAKKRGVSPKLQRRYKGQFRVTEVLYRLVPVEGGTESVVHFNRLKPFTSPFTVPSPPASGSRGKEQTSPPTRSPRCRRSGVQFGASWVHFRQHGRDVPE